MLMRTLRRCCACLTLLCFVSVLAAAEPGLPVAKPAEVGMNAEQLGRIPDELKKFVDDGAISGAVALVAKDGKIVHLEAVGLADVEGKLPMKKDALFAIASMTKPITATALMILVDEGKVALDDPVAKYIPAFKDTALKSGEKPKRAITVRDCLTHTAGLTGSQQNEGTLKETAEALAKRQLAGRVIEVAADKPYEVFLKERIFEPLGMTETSFSPTAEQQKRVAKLYKPGKEKKTLEATTHWLVDFSGKTSPNPSGGLFSTAADLSRFYQMVLNGGELDGKRILGPKSVELMAGNHIGRISLWDYFSPAAIGHLGDKFGLGFGVKSEAGQNELGSVGEYMWAGIFNTRFWIDPKEKMSIVFLGQLVPRVPEIEGKLHAAVYQAIVE
jgi:CubicO group peptidase (beta-lactamase class C family)